MNTHRRAWLFRQTGRSRPSLVSLCDPAMATLLRRATQAATSAAATAQRRVASMSAAQLGGAAAATAGVAGWYLMNQRAKRQDALLTMVSEAAQAQAGIDSLAQSTYDELSRQRQETPRAPKRQPDASAASGASDGAAAGKGKAAAAPAAGQRSAAAAETKTAHAMSKAAAAVKPYPAVEPYRTGRLRVSETHEICFYESGNPNGKPVVVVHGGPGGGSVPSDRQFFDPAVYRIIQFDQRGCGKSTPHASLERNTCVPRARAVCARVLCAARAHASLAQHVGPDRRYGALARALGRGQVDAVRRLVGLHAVAGVRRVVPQARDCHGAAWHLHAAEGGD